MPRTATCRARSRAPRKSHASFHPAQRKGYSGVALYAKHPPRVANRLRPRGIRRRRPLPAGGLRRALGHQRVPAVGVERPAPAGVEVPLPRRVPAASRERSCEAAAKSCCAATGTSRTSRSTLRTGAATRRTRASCPKSARGSRACSTSSASSTCSAASIARPDQYTWWSNRGQAWAKNVGWRIDYQIATPGIAATARAASIYKNRRFSDHAPLIIDYDYELR